MWFAGPGRYTEYLAGKVSEDDMCAEMVTMNRGLPNPICCAPRRVFRSEDGERIFSRDEGSDLPPA
jgi:hypothetical protein